FLNLTEASPAGDIKVETNNINTPPPLNLRRAARNSLTNQPVVSIAEEPSTTLSYLSWINFNTSFTGRDNLAIQLAAGTGNSPANALASAGLYNTFGVPFTDQSSLGTSDVVIRELFYTFPVGEQFRVTVGPRINWYRHFDGNRYTFFLTGAGSFNSSGGTLVNAIDRGSGAVVQWQFSDFAGLTVGYLGENTEFLPSPFFNTSSNPAKGLFGPTSTTTVQLSLNPINNVNFNAFYTYSKLDNNVPILDQNGNTTGFGVGGATSEPFYGVADDGFGGTINDAIAHTFAINGSWAITPNIGLFGRYTYGITNIDPVTVGRPDGEIRAQSLQLGVAFPDLGKEGALGTVSYLLPFSILEGRNFLAAGGGNGGIQYEFEATYFYPLSRNIALVPAFYMIGNANNFSDNPNIYVFNLRTQFSF
ncbi:MAG: iron uptake porin, partial [Spirulinaceae cyanobacterium]